MLTGKTEMIKMDREIICSHWFTPQSPAKLGLVENPGWEPGTQCTLPHPGRSTIPGALPAARAPCPCTDGKLVSELELGGPCSSKTKHPIPPPILESLSPQKQAKEDLKSRPAGPFPSTGMRE